MRRPLQPSRLSLLDVLRLGAYGLRTRPLRVVLSALGIAVGIAAMVAVVGISTSSRAELNRLLATLGTNLLTAAPGTGLFGGQGTLPGDSVAMIGRIPAVQNVSAIGLVPGAGVYRNDRIPPGQTGGLGAYAVSSDLLDTVGGAVASGIWFNEAIAQYPAVVLGYRTAQRLGIETVHGGIQIWIGGQWFTVIGILDPVPLARRLDTGALMGWEAARQYLNQDVEISTVFVRVNPGSVEAVRGVLARTAHPAAPDEVNVSRASDALAAEAAVDIAFTGLLLGLGGVALLVGGIGVANTMVISVLERRAEIGLRRSQGATRGHIRLQFLGEALLLSVLGGAAGVVFGLAVTAAYATLQRWPTVVPLWAMVGGIAAPLFIGALAGLYPAARAAQVAPTEALAAA